MALFLTICFSWIILIILWIIRAISFQTAFLVGVGISILLPSLVLFVRSEFFQKHILPSIKRRLFLVVMLVTSVFAATLIWFLREAPSPPSPLDVATYTPKVGHGVRCGASQRDFLADRKEPLLLSLDPLSKSRVYAESVLDPIFSRVEYTLRGGNVVDISAYSSQAGVYQTLSTRVEEALLAPAEVSSYPDPVRTRWVFGTMDVSILEEAGEVVLRTSCPMEAGR